MRKRAYSEILSTTLELDFYVLSYKVTDPTIHKALGLNTKECEWTVQCRTAPPLKIKVLFDKNVLGRTEVQITCNEQQIFPMGGGVKSRLIENFQQTWPFRGMAKGINEIHFVEVRLYHQGQELWFAGTVTKQRTDGFFEVLAYKPGIGGYFNEELYPFVNKKDLRVMLTKEAYTAPERYLVLQVPANDPLHDTRLTVDGGENITQFFGRPTPNPKAPAQPKFLMTVAKDRSMVSGNIGHRELMAYWSGEARAINMNPKRPGKLVGFGSKAWTLMVGLSEHTIEVERKHHTSKHVTVTIDKELLIEALAEDLGYDGPGWQVTFRFVGEPSLEFEVHETDPNGSPLESKGMVVQTKIYSRVCVIHIADMSNLSIAVLHVDGRDFKELPLYQEAHQQQQISISPTAMVSQYHITVPYKVNKEASASNADGVKAFFNMSTNPLFNGQNNMRPNDFQGPDMRYNQNQGLLGFLACCCGEQALGPDTRDPMRSRVETGHLVYVAPALEP